MDKDIFINYAEEYELYHLLEEGLQAKSAGKVRPFCDVIKELHKKFEQ